MKVLKYTTCADGTLDEALYFGDELKFTSKSTKDKNDLTAGVDSDITVELDGVIIGQGVVAPSTEAAAQHEDPTV